MEERDRKALRLYTRSRMDFQQIRKAIGNRLGKKADWTDQDVGDRRDFDFAQLDDFEKIAKEAKKQEAAIEKMLEKTLKRQPVFEYWLQHQKGVSNIGAGWLLGEIDIEKATTVSKIWQYAGLNPSDVRGKIRVDAKDYKPSHGPIVKTIIRDGKPEAHIVLTDELIRGDKPAKGFVLPYNKPLRTAILGVIGDNFIKAQSPYALDFYYPYKLRKEQSHAEVLHLKKMTPWKDVSKGHRHSAAKRHMMKMFLKDLYVAWRECEGLSVRESYAAQYLGRHHDAESA